MKLVYKESGIEVKVGDAAQTHRGETVIVDSWETPKSPASTGRVHVVQGGTKSSFYPSVIDAEFVEREDRKEANAAQGAVYQSGIKVRAGCTAPQVDESVSCPLCMAGSIVRKHF